MSHQTYNGIYINKDSQQIIVGSNPTYSTTLNINVPSASRNYTITDVGKTASFLMNDSVNGQTLNGNISLSGTISGGSLTTTLMGNNLVGSMTGGYINSSTFTNPSLSGTLSGGNINNVSFSGDNTLTGSLYNGTLSNFIVNSGVILSNVSISGGGSSGLASRIEYSTISNSTLTSNNYNNGNLIGGTLSNVYFNNGTILSNSTIVGNISSSSDVSYSNINSSTLSGTNYNIGTLMNGTFTNATITSGYISEGVYNQTISTLKTEVTNLETNIINTSYYYVLPDGSSLASQSFSTARIYTSIQSAINAASANGGGVVKLLEGTYTLSSNIILYSGVILEGTYTGASNYSTTMVGGTIVKSDVSTTLRYISLSAITGETSLYTIAIIGIRFISVSVNLYSSTINVYGLSVKKCNFYYSNGSTSFINLSTSYQNLNNVEVSDNIFENTGGSVLVTFSGKINKTGDGKLFVSNNIFTTPSMSSDSALKIIIAEDGALDSYSKNIIVDSNISRTSRFCSLQYLNLSTGKPIHYNTIFSNNRVISQDFGNGILNATPTDTVNFIHTIYYVNNFINGSQFFRANMASRGWSSSAYGNYYFISNILGTVDLTSTTGRYLAQTNTSQSLGGGNFILENPGWNLISSVVVVNTFTFQNYYEASQFRLSNAISGGTSLTTIPKIDIIPGTSNQMTFYTPTNSTTINVNNPSTSGMIYTVQNIGKGGSFMMSEGSKVVNGSKTFTNVINSTITNSSLSNCLIGSNNIIDTLTNNFLNSTTLTNNNYLTGSLSNGYITTTIYGNNTFNSSINNTTNNITFYNSNLEGTLSGGCYSNSLFYNNNTLSGTISNGFMDSLTLGNISVIGSLTGGTIYCSSLTNYNYLNDTISSVYGYLSLTNNNFIGNLSLTKNIVLGNVTLYNSLTSRIYTLSDVGSDGNFVMNLGNQTISGIKTFNANLYCNNIGIGTSSPSAPLQITPTLQTRDVSSNGIYVYNPNNADNEYSIISAKVGGTSVVRSALASFDVNTVNGWSVGVDNTDSQKFKIANSNNDLTSNTCITINTSQKVGIGTTNPTSTLHVNGTFQATSETITTSVITGDPVGAPTGSYAGNYGFFQLSSTNSSYVNGTSTLIWDNVNTYFSSGITHNNGVFNFSSDGIYSITVSLVPSSNVALSKLQLYLNSSNDGVTFSGVYMKTSQNGAYYNVAWSTLDSFKSIFMINVTSTTRYWRIQLANSSGANFGFTTGQSSKVMIGKVGSTSYACFPNSLASITATAGGPYATSFGTASYTSGDITTSGGVFTFTQSGIYLMYLQYTPSANQATSQSYIFILTASTDNVTYVSMHAHEITSAFYSDDAMRMIFYLDTSIYKYWKLTYNKSGTLALSLATTLATGSYVSFCKIDSDIYSVSRPNWGNFSATGNNVLTLEQKYGNAIKINGTNGVIYFNYNGVYLISLRLNSGTTATVSHSFIVQYSSDGITWSANLYSSLERRPYTGSYQTNAVTLLIQVTDSTRYWRIVDNITAAFQWDFYWDYSNVGIFSITTPTISSASGGLYKQYYNSGEIIKTTVVEDLSKYFSVGPYLSQSVSGGSGTIASSSYTTSGTKLFQYIFNVTQNAGDSILHVYLGGSYYYSGSGAGIFNFTLEYKNANMTDYKAKSQVNYNLTAGGCRSNTLLPFNAIFKNTAGVSNSHTLTGYIGANNASIFNIDYYFSRSWNLKIAEIRL